MIFVDVPVTPKNTDLHQGLKVPSLPYGHIYHPERGLVQEWKISKKFFPQFKKVVESYALNGCVFLDDEIAPP